MRHAAVLLGLLLLAAGARAAERDSIFELTDGTRLVGKIIAEDDQGYRLRTPAGLVIDVPRKTVLSLVRGDAAPAPPPTRDPNYSRLLFGPTGRPLKKGDGYFSDYELLFPGGAFGLTDHFSIGGGVSVIPGVAPSEQLLYISPKLGFDLGPRTSLAVGALYATVPDEGDLAVLFGVGTFGGRDKSLSVGLGVANDRVEDGFDHATPIIMLGGNVTVSRHAAFVGETWLVLEDDFNLADQPFGLGVRLFGGRLSADLGLVVIPEYVASGGIFPWASVSYHFGSTASGLRDAVRAAHRRGH